MMIIIFYLCYIFNLVFILNLPNFGSNNQQKLYYHTNASCKLKINKLLKINLKFNLKINFIYFQLALLSFFLKMGYHHSQLIYRIIGNFR